MAISTTWVNFVNGATGAAIRSALNTFNTEILADVISNEGRIGAVEPKVTLNTGDIADVDVRVTGAEADIVNLENPNSVPLVPQIVAPTHVAGQFYYSEAEGAFKAQGPVAGVEISVGHGMHIHAVNNTGEILVKGTVVRRNGVAGGQLQVAKAIATSFMEASVLGIIQADIGIGAEGAVVTFGELNNIDTSGFPVGVPLYLSDTIAGTVTASRPDIVSQVFGVFTSDAITGRLFVMLDSNISLPTIYSSISNASAPLDVSASLVTYTPITDYSDSSKISIPSDIAAGTITPNNTGAYRATVSLGLDFDGLGNQGKKELWVIIRDVTTNAIVEEVKAFLLKDAETFNFSMSPIVTLTAAHAYRIEIKSEVDLDNIAYSLSSFDIESLNIT